jgi:hypothetical protein
VEWDMGNCSGKVQISVSFVSQLKVIARNSLKYAQPVLKQCKSKFKHSRKRGLGYEER